MTTENERNAEDLREAQANAVDPRADLKAREYTVECIVSLGDVVVASGDTPASGAQIAGKLTALAGEVGTLAEKSFTQEMRDAK